jgi:hypothetical protein
MMRLSSDTLEMLSPDLVMRYGLMANGYRFDGFGDGGHAVLGWK